MSQKYMLPLALFALIWRKYVRVLCLLASKYLLIWLLNQIIYIYIEESSISNHFTIKTKNQTTREPNTDTSNNQHRGHVTSKQIVSSPESGTTIMNTATSGTLKKLVKKPSYTGTFMFFLSVFQRCTDKTQRY